MARILLRFLQDAGGTRSVSVSCPDDKDWVVAARVLRAATNDSPLPPDTEKHLWTGLPHAALCDGPGDEPILQLRQNILLGDPDVGDIERLGGYLFAVLLGSWWDGADGGDIGTRFKGDSIDFELSFGPGAEALHAYPWEMVFVNGRPLIVESKQPVSFTRVVDHPSEQATIGFPVRVLFIVGELDDGLRAGAEYLGLIRGISTSLRDQGQEVAAMVAVRSLINASRDDITALCDVWPPHIVHLVAHGEVSKGGAKAHLTKLVTNAATPDPVDATTLCGLFKGTNGKSPLPGLVVVNASQPGEPGVHLSLAASLVANGVAAAIGMAGEVASAACRVFTHAFYRALAAHRPLAKAVASGQRAAALHYGQFEQNVEWARPALFVSTGPPLKFILDDSHKTLAAVVALVRGQPLAFCDRYDALDAFSQFSLRVDKGGAQMLAFEQSTDGGEKKFDSGEVVRYQIGKTQLLNEIEWHALIDGLLPCYIRTNRGEQLPNNLLLFALRLASLLDECRGRFGLQRRRTSEALDLARAQLKPDPFAGISDTQAAFNTARDTTIAAFKSGVGTGWETLSVASIGDAIRSDIEMLIAAVRPVCNHVRGVLVIVDDFEKYKGFADCLLDLVGDYGLGSAAAPAPLVVTYLAQGAGADIRKRLVHSPDVRKRTIYRTLDPFPAGTGAELAYGQYLQSRQLAPARQRAARDRVKALFEVMHEDVAGVPSYLRMTNLAIKLAFKNGELVINDDEAIFAKMNDE